MPTSPEVYVLALPWEIRWSDWAVDAIINVRLNDNLNSDKHDCILSAKSLKSQTSHYIIYRVVQKK